MQLHSSVEELSTHIRRVVHRTAVSRHPNIENACHANEILSPTSCLMLVMAYSTTTLVCGGAVVELYRIQRQALIVRGILARRSTTRGRSQKMKAYSIRGIGSIHAAFGNNALGTSELPARRQHFNLFESISRCRRLKRRTYA